MFPPVYQSRDLFLQGSVEGKGENTWVGIEATGLLTSVSALLAVCVRAWLEGTSSVAGGGAETTKNGKSKIGEISRCNNMLMRQKQSERC